MTQRANIYFHEVFVSTLESGSQSEAAPLSDRVIGLSFEISALVLISFYSLRGNLACCSVFYFWSVLHLHEKKNKKKMLVILFLFPVKGQVPVRCI